MTTTDLNAGVAANLWDVTDGDIDRFTIAMMERLSAGDNVSQAVAAARQSCVLKFLVGAAPVVYGIPVNFML